MSKFWTPRTPRYKLRTLLILLAVLPPLLWIGWTKYAAWRAEQERQRVFEELRRNQPFVWYQLGPRDKPPEPPTVQR